LTPLPKYSKADFHAQDIGIAGDIARLVEETVQRLGGLDIIINNAGWTRFAKFDDINDLSHEEWDKAYKRRLPTLQVSD
jgi:NAD(P)-dependent dehydrogenase (short-subunit alcohol dehydrogenase family)